MFPVFATMRSGVRKARTTFDIINDLIVAGLSTAGGFIVAYASFLVMSARKVPRIYWASSIGYIFLPSVFVWDLLSDNFVIDYASIFITVSCMALITIALSEYRSKQKGKLPPGIG